MESMSANGIAKDYHVEGFKKMFICTFIPIIVGTCLRKELDFVLLNFKRNIILSEIRTG